MTVRRKGFLWFENLQFKNLGGKKILARYYFGCGSRSILPGVLGGIQKKIEKIAVKRLQIYSRHIIVVCTFVLCFLFVL